MVRTSSIALGKQFWISMNRRTLTSVPQLCPWRRSITGDERECAPFRLMLGVTLVQAKMGLLKRSELNLVGTVKSSSSPQTPVMLAEQSYGNKPPVCANHFEVLNE